MPKPEDEDRIAPMIFPSEMARRAGREEPAEGATELRPPAPRAALALSLTVENRDQPDVHPRTFPLGEAPVTIGRGADCELRLDDERRLVSSRHARITAGAGGLELCDLHSKNLTYLNGAALDPDSPHSLTAGDLIEIGSFALRVEAAEEPAEAPPPSDETVLAPDFVNPFRDDAGALADVLARIAELYDGEAPGRRDAALEEALEEALEASSGHQAHQTLARVLDRRL